VKGVDHYLKSGTLFKGKNHKMEDGTLHTGTTHTKASKKLFHLKDLPKNIKASIVKSMRKKS